MDNLHDRLNLNDSYEQVQHLPPIGRSDHQTLLFKPKIGEKTKPIVRRIRQMKPENIRSLGLKLNLESWDAVFDTSDVDEKVKSFMTLFVVVLKSASSQYRINMPLLLQFPK